MYAASLRLLVLDVLLSDLFMHSLLLVRALKEPGNEVVVLEGSVGHTEKLGVLTG